MSNLKFYKCALCGRVDYVAYPGGEGEKKCCEVEMTLLQPNTTDAAGEKHLPVIERQGDKVKVTVSTEIHPMTEDHFITFIVVHHGNKVQQHILTPSDEPIASFDVPASEKLVAYEYCNLHGLWSAVE